MCTNGICVCPPTFIANSLNTKCLPVTNGYGSSCLDNVQCSHSLNGGGVCENDICVCTKGYHYFLGQCWKTAGLGESCKHNANCFVSNDFEAAVCSENKICACSPNYYQREYSSCRRESYRPGDPCGIYLDCKFDNAACSVNRTCEASNAIDNFAVYFYNNNSNEQTTLSKLKLNDGDSCNSNADCPRNAECNESHKCSCLKGYYSSDKNVCFPEVGGNCKLDSDCIGKNTQCRNGTVCVCKQGFVTSYNGQYCDKMSRNIGWSCLRDEQCGFFGPNAICLKKKCWCNEKSHFVEKELYCWIKKHVKESCISNEDCGERETVSCIEKKCQCNSGSHASSDKSTCRKDSTKVGETCEEKLDCIFDNSFCDMKTKKCDCLSGYINQNGSCIPGVGAHCKQTSECKADGSFCVEEKCVCKSNFTSSSDFSKCLPDIFDLSVSCTESSQCKKIEGECVGGHCKCFSGSHFVGGWQCFLTRNIDEPCTSKGNCSNVENSYCFKGTCKCLPGHQPQRNGTLCSGISNKFDVFSTNILLISTYFFIKILK